MITYQVDILNPKAGKLLQDLADLDLISIRQTSADGFMNVVNRLRAKATPQVPTLDEITKEVEIVRMKTLCQEKGIELSSTRIFGLVFC